MSSRKKTEPKIPTRKEEPFVIITGLTKRLIYAYDIHSAREKFLRHLTHGSGDKLPREFHPVPGEIVIRRANDDDLFDFKRKRRVKTFKDETLGDIDWGPRFRRSDGA